MVNHTRHTKKQNGGEGNRSKIVMDAILEKLKTFEPEKKVEIIKALMKSENHTDFNIEEFKNEIIHSTNKIKETKFDQLWEKIKSRDNEGDKFLKYYLNIFYTENQIQKTSKVEIQTPLKQKNPQNTCVEEQHSKFDELNDEEKKLVHNETDRTKAHNLLENVNGFLIRKSISPQDSITLVKRISDTIEDIKICKGKDDKLYTNSAKGIRNPYNNLKKLVEDYSSKHYTFVNPTSTGVLRRRKKQLHRGPLTPPKKQIYVLVFDYDHTLTNSYVKDNNNNHSNGYSWHNDEKLNPKFKQEINKSIYDATVENRGNYAKLRNQLCTLKKNGVLMFVNSRGIQEQLVERLKADELSEFFGIGGEYVDVDINLADENQVAKGNIGNGIYGAYGTTLSNTIGRGDWHKIKLQVIEHILGLLRKKNKINEDNTELHFFDDEDANVNAFNTKFIENENRVGHKIGKRGREERNSITQELEDFITKTLQQNTLPECPAHTALTAGSYRKTLHKSKKSRKSKKTKKSSKKTSKKH